MLWFKNNTEENVLSLMHEFVLLVKFCIAKKDQAVYSLMLDQYYVV